MPRNAPRQPPRAPGDQAYGAAGDQLAAQAAMPLPDMHAAGPAGPGEAPADPMAAALTAGSGLAAEPAPWANAVPDEDITAGLPGHGGPPVLDQGIRAAPVGEMLLAMADATGDPYLAELAQQAEALGR